MSQEDTTNLSKNSDGKKETIYSFILSMSSKLVTYFLLLVFANLFVLESYGKASFVLSVFKIILLLAAIGLPYVFVPWHINKKDSTSVFYFLLIITLIVTVIGSIYSIKYIWVLPLVLTLPFILLSNIGQAFLRIKHKYHIIQAINLAFTLLVLFGVYFLRTQEEAGIIIAHTIAYLSISLFSISLTFKDIKHLAKPFKFNIEPIKTYFKKGLITAALYMSFYFLNWVDSTILGFLSTFENVARYNVAGPVSNVITAIPLALSMFLLTRSSEIKSEETSIGILKRAMRISFSFSLISAMLISSLIYLLVEIFFPKYMGIEIYIIILLIGILFYTIYSLYYTYLMGKLSPEKALLPIGGAALINIILDIILIPKYGLYGITIATTFSHFFALTLLSWKMGFRKDLISTLFITLIFIPLSYYLGLCGLLLIPFALISLHLTKILKIKDIRIVLDTIIGILRNIF